MLWDGMIILLALTLAIAGWNVGIINSWRGPVAVIIATLVTQQFYVDFAAWIVQQLRVQPDMAVVMGYLLLWGGIEIIGEILLNIVLSFGTKQRPQLFERIAGSALGLAKTFIIVLLPIMCLHASAQNKIPGPPEQTAKLKVLMVSGVEESSLISFFGSIAKAASPTLGMFVISKKEPSFKPNFSRPGEGDATPEPPESK